MKQQVPRGADLGTRYFTVHSRAALRLPVLHTLPLDRPWDSQLEVLWWRGSAEVGHMFQGAAASEELPGCRKVLQHHVVKRLSSFQ